MEQRRRTRRLQERRLRRDLDTGAQDQRRHRRRRHSASIRAIPDTIYAAAHQRRRHVWTLVGGGPESALHKSVDGGQELAQARVGAAQGRHRADRAWRCRRRTRTLSTRSSKPRRTRAASSAPPIAARAGRSAPAHSTSGNYYSELFADPHQFDRVYSMDTFLQVSDDGGKSFPQPGREVEACRQPRDLDRSARRRPLPRRLRRRPLRELRPRRHLALLREPAAHPVLPRRRRQRAALLQRLRRHPGQLLALRTVAHTAFPGPGQRGLGSHARAATASGPSPIRPTRTSSTPKRSTACSPASTAEAARTSTSSRSRAPESRRCAGTGTRRWCSRRTRRPGSTSPPTGSSAATTAATAGRRSRPTSPASSTATSSRSWAGSSARRRWPRTPRPRSTATSSRSPSRRSRPACSTSAPTTA